MRDDWKLLHGASRLFGRGERAYQCEQKTNHKRKYGNGYAWAKKNDEDF